MTPEPLDREPSGTRRGGRRWRVGAGLLIVLAGLFAFAVLQGGADGGSEPLNAIAAAAGKTQEEPGARAVMHAIFSSPAKGTFTMTGHMAFNAEGRSRAVLSVPPSDSHDAMEMEMVMDGTFMYMRSSKLGTLPGGAEWMGLDLSLGQRQDAPLRTSGDARGELAILEAVTGGVRKLGKENVRGVPTTHYSGTISGSERAQHLREEGEEDLASGIEAEDSELQIEAWIDGKGLVRRMRLVHTQPQNADSEPRTIDMSFDLFDFGFEPEIDLPESNEVFDATDLAREEIESR